MEDVHITCHDGAFAVAQVIGDEWLFIPRLSWDRAMQLVRRLSDGGRMIVHASVELAAEDVRLAPLFRASLVAS